MRKLRRKKLGIKIVNKTVWANHFRHYYDRKRELPLFVRCHKSNIKYVRFSSDKDKGLHMAFAERLDVIKIYGRFLSIIYKFVSINDKNSIMTFRLRMKI